MGVTQISTTGIDHWPSFIEIGEIACSTQEVHLPGAPMDSGLIFNGRPRDQKTSSMGSSFPQVARQLFGNFSYFEQIWSFRTTFCIPGNFSSIFLLILRYRSSLSLHPLRPPGAKAGLLGQQFFKENSKWWTKIHRLHSIDSSDSGEEGHSTILLAHTKFFTRLILPKILMRSLYSYSFGFNWGQSYLETRWLRHKIAHCHLLHNLHQTKQRKRATKNTEKRLLFFPATFEQPSRYKKQLLTFLSDSVLMNFLRNCGKRFWKFRATRLGLGER